MKNYRNLLYSIVVAVLAFAVDKEDSLLFLVPFAAIIPIYLMAMSQVKSMMRTVAYIYVFLEPNTECKWETRLYERDKLHRIQHNSKKTSIDPYWGVSICCIALSVLNLNFKCIDYKFYLSVSLQFLILLVCIYVFIKKRPDYYKVKSKYISEWREIKRREQKRKRRQINNDCNYFFNI